MLGEVGMIFPLYKRGDGDLRCKTMGLKKYIVRFEP